MLQNRKTRWIQLLACMICCVMLIGFGKSETAFAEGALQKVYDDADLFTDSEEEALQELAEELAERWEYDVAVATTDYTYGQPTYQYAIDFYEEKKIGCGENYRGILLLIDMDNREVYIDEYNASESNYEISTYERECILDVIMEYAYDGDFYGVADAFLNELPNYYGNDVSGDDDYRDAIENGEPGDQYTPEPLTAKEKLLQSAPMAAIISLVIAGITLIVLFARQKSGGRGTAADYQSDNIKLENKQDLYINTTTVRHVIETETRSGGDGGSSYHGGGHSGGGRSF